jgi:hypothetical protein
LSGLNHFTVPVATSNTLLSCPVPDLSAARGGDRFVGRPRVLLEALNSMRNPRPEYTQLGVATPYAEPSPK